MDSSTPTEEFEPSRAPSPVARAPSPVEQTQTEIRRPPIPAIPAGRDQCASCGAALAPDQRYCVECGQRRGGARPPFIEQPPARSGPTPAGLPAQRRPLMSINATLLAGVGTLLLAMGIGILIGRSGQGSSAKTPAVQLLSTPATGAAGATVGGSTSAEATLPGASTPTSTTASKSGASTSTSKSTASKAKAPLPKAVKIGSKGSGPGYQKGKFTGNFFGEGEE